MEGSSLLALHLVFPRTIPIPDYFPATMRRQETTTTTSSTMMIEKGNSSASRRSPRRKRRAQSSASSKTTTGENQNNNSRTACMTRLWKSFDRWCQHTAIQNYWTDFDADDKNDIRQQYSDPDESSCHKSNAILKQQQQQQHPRPMKRKRPRSCHAPLWLFAFCVWGLCLETRMSTTTSMTVFAYEHYQQRDNRNNSRGTAEAAFQQQQQQQQQQQKPLLTLRERQQRWLQIAAPPEEEVSATPTPFPTFVRTPIPSKQPTPRPTTQSPSRGPTPTPTTTAPSLAPTRRPTTRPTSTPTTKPTAEPTGGPSGNPTPHPTRNPTSRPSLSPTVGPTVSPTFILTRIPTVAPSHLPLSAGETILPSAGPTSAAPTRSPTRSPTMSPSLGPTGNPASTTIPTFNPTKLGVLGPTPETPTPQSSEEVTLAPTEIVWENFTVTTAVQVFLELPSNQRASPVGLANIWQRYVESTLKLVYSNSNEVVQLNEVLVRVDGQAPSPNGGRNNSSRRLRVLQEEDDTIVQSFRVDTTVDLEKNVNHPSGGDGLDGQVEQLVKNLMTAENLQQSLDDANVEGVRVSAVTQPNSNRNVAQSKPKKKPTLIELIIGFALVGIMVAVLLVTLHSRIKKIRKRRKKRRIQKLRQQNSYVMPKQEKPMPASPAKSKNSSDVGIFVDDDDGDSSDDIVGTYYADDEQLPDLPTVGTSDDLSDPFASELKKAAVMDDAAWNALQRKKEELKARGLVVDTMYSTAAGSGEEGVEIGAGLAAANIPYGVDRDESKTPSSPSPSVSSPPHPVATPTKQHLSPDDAIKWTTSGALSLNIVGRNVNPDSSFEPYGESKSSMQESWDNNETTPSSQQTDSENFGQYSFMNPLRPRSSDTAQARASPTSMSEDPSTVAVRASMSVSSWSEVDGNDLRASPTESMVPLGMIRETSRDSNSYSTSDPGNNTSNNNDDSLQTMDMLQEVQRLSAYVKRYEKKKEMQKSLSGGGSTVSYDAMSDSVSAQRRGNASPPRSRVPKGTYRQAAVNHTTSMESSGFSNLESSSELSGGASESEDELSTRLGISRFSIQTSGQSHWYSVEELPIPSPASPMEDDSLLLPPSPGLGMSMESSRDISGPVAPDKPMDRPSSPPSDLPEDERVGKLGKPKPGKLGGKLSKLRGTGNMLDGEEKSQHTNPSDESTREQAAAEKQRSPAPPVRSKNRGFTNIISMFEAKPNAPIAPPNENWQHGVKTTPKK